MDNDKLEEILQVLMKASAEAKVAVRVEMLEDKKINIFIRPAEADNEREKIVITEPDEKEEYIGNLLKKMGIQSSLLGYKYIMASMKILLINRDILLTKVIYPKIAREYQTTPAKVERVIRYSIELAWKSGNLEMIDCKEKKPTNKEFLLSLVDYISKEKKEQ